MYCSFRKRVKSISLLLVFACAIGLTGCSHPAGSGGKIKTMVAEGNLSALYTDISGLKKDATDIVECKVLNSKTIVYCDTPFTISTVELLGVVKGQKKAGDKINVIEMGGIFSLTGEDPKEAKGQLVDYQLEGIPVMKASEHYYLFLKPFEGPQTQNAYVPLGAFQGKFKISSGNNITQQAPNDIKIKGLSALNKNDFLKKVNESA